MKPNNNEPKKSFDRIFLSKLFVHAMGTRKQKEFAELIGISKETANRIVKKGYGSPLKKETLKKIAMCSENRVRYSELLVACGYKPSYGSEEMMIWHDSNLDSIRSFVDEYLNGSAKLVGAETQESYNLLYSVDSEASFSLSAPKNCLSTDFPECDSYCVLKVRWKNTDLKVCLTTYVMLLGYVKRDDRFCMIRATMSPKDMAKIDPEMKFVLEKANDSMLEDGLDVYDEEMFEEMSFEEDTADSHTSKKPTEEQITFLKDLLSKKEVLSGLSDEEKVAVAEILRNL